MKKISRRTAITTTVAAIASASATGIQVSQTGEEPISAEMQDLVDKFRAANKIQQELGDEAEQAEILSKEIYEAEGIKFVPTSLKHEIDTTELLEALKREDFDAVGADNYVEFRKAKYELEKEFRAIDRRIYVLAGIIGQHVDLDRFRVEAETAIGRAKDALEAITAHNDKLDQRSGYPEANRLWEDAIDAEDKARVALLKYFPKNGAEATLKRREAVTELTDRDSIYEYWYVIDAMIEGLAPSPASAI